MIMNYRCKAIINGVLHHQVVYKPLLQELGQIEQVLIIVKLCCGETAFVAISILLLILEYLIRNY